MNRIHIPLTKSHLEIIRDIALEEFNRFCNEAGNPTGKFKVYRDKLIGIFLCQGAAQHYIDNLNIKHEEIDHRVYVNEEEILKLEDKSNGVKFDREGNVLAGIQDIDIWFFFHEDEDVYMNSRGCKKEKVIFLDGIGNIKVDFMKKTIGKKISNLVSNNESEKLLKNYLKYAGTDTSYYLGQKSIIGIFPETILNKPVYICKRKLDSFKEVGF